MQKFIRITIASIAFVVLILAASLSAQQSLAQATHPHKTSAHQGASAGPLLTGDDGTQTGVAKFQGNFTAITAPSGQVLALTREPDCSLTLLTGSYSFGPPLSYTSSALFSNYERILHTNAGLFTAVDAFPTGCAAPATGLSTRPTTFVGKTSNGISVFIYVGYNFALNTNALYVLTGTATFTLNSFAFSNAGAVTTADLNGDGNTDLIIVSNGAISTAGEIYVMLGNPDGSFQTAVPYPTSGTTSLAAVVDDFNGDGKLDIVTSSDNGMISVLTGNGDGSFKAAQSFAAPTPSYPGFTQTPSTSIINLISADLRGVGKKDIIASNGLVLLGNGDGSFTPASSAAFPPLTALTNFGPNLATGDINKDGKLDLAVANGSDVFTYLGKGDGTFTPNLGYIAVNTDGFVAISDLDGDGNPDIYIGDANAGSFRGDGDDTNVAYALMGNGDGTFSGAPTISGHYTGTNLGDVNGDGQQDIITTSGNSFTVQLGTPKGTFNPASTITLPPSVTVSVSELLSPVTISAADIGISSYAVGDLNGDGKADLAFVSNLNGYAVYFVALNNGDGTFATPIAYGFPQIAPSSGFDITTTITNLRIGDFNHDGKADLLFSFNDVAGPFGTGLYLQGIGVLPGVGNGTFGAPTFTYSYNSTTTPPTDPIVGLPSVAAVADLNKDGNPDLIVVTPSGGPSSGFGNILQTYIGKGDGTFAAPATVNTAANPGSICPSCSVVVADFNNDSNLDLAVVGETNSAQGQIAISLGNGSGAFAAPTILNVSGGDAVRSSGIAAADFDGDGNIDIAFLNNEGVSGVYYGKGNGAFTSVTSNGTSYPKDLINLAADGGAIALDLNKDGKPDILVNNAILLNLGNAAPTIVTQTNTATAMTTSATTIAQNSSITFTATVTPASGSTIPTGSVTFADGQTIFGSATVDGTGKAAFTTSALASGTRSITAAFDGSANFLGSISSVATVNVTPAATGVATSTALSASATTTTAGTSITFTATVTPASGTTVPAGTVTFADAGTTIGTGTLDPTGKATLSTSTLAVGSHSITASYGGATTPAFSNSASSPVTVTITPAPIISTTTTVSTSAVGGTATAGTSITLTATVTPASGTISPTGTVTFADNATTIGTGTLTSGKATFTTTTLAVGSHSITAAYGGAATFSSSTSAAQPLTITAAPASDFSITLSHTTDTVARSSNIVDTITIASINGFNQAATLTCAGAPANSICAISPPSVTPTGTTAATATLTLTTSVTTTSFNRRRRNFEFAATLPFGLLASIIVFGSGRRRRDHYPLQLLVLCAATILLTAIGCGGKGSSSTTNTPTPGTYPLTVTGASGALTHTATYTVTIQ